MSSSSSAGSTSSVSTPAFLSIEMRLAPVLGYLAFILSTMSFSFSEDNAGLLVSGFADSGSFVSGSACFSAAGSASFCSFGSAGFSVAVSADFGSSDFSTAGSAGFSAAVSAGFSASSFLFLSSTPDDCDEDLLLESFIFFNNSSNLTELS